MAARKTQKEKILNLMKNGKNLTARQAKSRLKVQNLAGRIAELREDGFTIYRNSVKVTSGNRTFRVPAYRLDDADASTL